MTNKVFMDFNFFFFLIDCYDNASHIGDESVFYYEFESLMVFLWNVMLCGICTPWKYIT